MQTGNTNATPASKTALKNATKLGKANPPTKAIGRSTIGLQWLRALEGTAGCADLRKVSEGFHRFS
jgi:hypothetical protein